MARPAFGSVPARLGPSIEALEQELDALRNPNKPPSQAATLRYRLTTTVPDNWIPFVPVRDPGGLVYFGFPFSAEQAESYYFVFEERVGETRFGLDVPSPEGTILPPGSQWGNLGWDHFTHSASANGAELPEDGWYIDGLNPYSPDESTGTFVEASGWKGTSAQIARATVLLPVRVAIKLGALVGSD